MTSPRVEWIDAAQFLARAPLMAVATCLVVDLDDPDIAPAVLLAPTRLDLVDMARPLAGPRGYFLKRRSLLRSLVAVWTGGAPDAVIVAHDERGAPRVESLDASIFVSVAARGPVACVAVAGKPLGVDLELVEAPSEPVWEALHPSERHAVEQRWRTGSDDVFRDVWIAKEAYLKMLGDGLKRDPATVSIHLEGDDSFSIENRVAAGSGHYATRDIGARKVRCAVFLSA